jgi:tetratricopeptide (TPR) repeat protein
MTSAIDDLRKQIEKGDVLVIVGAGVSIGATNRAEVASWTGLLRDGVEHCMEFAIPKPSAKWRSVVLQEIELGEEGDTSSLLSAAEKIAGKLGAPKGGGYRKWLRETVGALKAINREVLEALRDLEVTLATTNYDGLLEEVTDRDPVTWLNINVERVVGGEDQGILHLHGFWKEPESIVLGIRSYLEVLRDERAQNMQRALRTTRTFLFVGCGEGLGDPNLGALLKWTRAIFAESETLHYRLALEADVVKFQDQHPAEERIKVISFGMTHDKLAGFLLSLKPSKPSKPLDPTPTTRLPGLPRGFYGRETEFADLVDTLLSDNPPPTPVLGDAGHGKSALTLEALHDPRVAARVGARRYFVRGESAPSRATLVGEIAKAMKVPLVPDLESAVFAAIEVGPALLVLDNTETPWHGDSRAVEEFLGQLAAIPHVALVASIRGHARPGEVPWREAITVGPLDLDSARKAFLNVAGTKFRADPRLDDLLRAVDRMPLAVELLAYVAESEADLAPVWERWQAERSAMLRRGDGTHRQMNLGLSLEISIQGPRMDDDARRLLSLLGFLPDGIAREDVNALLPGRGLASASKLRQVGLAFDDGARLRVLVPVREHVGEKHPPSAADRDRAIDHFVALGESLGAKVGAEGGAEAVKRLGADLANLNAMILAGLDRTDPDPAIAAAAGLANLTLFTGLGSSGPLERGVEVARSSNNPGGEARCHYWLGVIAYSRSDHDAARRRYEVALPLYRRVDDVQGEADCIRRLGDIARERSDHNAARQRYDDALSLYRGVGYVEGEADCIRRLGDIALARSDHDAARQRYEDALPLYRRVGSVRGEASCICRLGNIALARSDHDAARQRYEVALPLYQRVGDIEGEADCIKSLGDIAFDRSDHDAARQRYEDALPLYKRVGSVLGEANCIRSLGDIALRRSDDDAARQRYEDALPLYRRVGDVLGEANCIQGLGDIALDRSDHDAAREHFVKSLGLYQKIPEPYSIGSAHRRIARIAGNDDERRDHARAARDSWRSIGRDDLIERYLGEFAGLLDNDATEPPPAREGTP